MSTDPGEEFVTITFQVQRKRVSALRAVLFLAADQVADKLTKNLPYPKAQAYTDAAIALGELRKVTREYGMNPWVDK